MSTFQVNVHHLARATQAIVQEANPITGGDRDSFGKLTPFVKAYTPYADASNPASIESICKSMGAGAGAAPAAAK